MPVLQVQLLEPRDVLQSERTLLTFVRFATSLYFTAIGMALRFRLTSGLDKPEKKSNTLFNKVMAVILLMLAFATLVASGANYLQTVRRYSLKRIHTYGFNNMVMVTLVTAVVLTLIGINVALIVQRAIT